MIREIQRSDLTMAFKIEKLTEEQKKKLVFGNLKNLSWDLDVLSEKN